MKSLSVRATRVNSEQFLVYFVRIVNGGTDVQPYRLQRLPNLGEGVWLPAVAATPDYEAIDAMRGVVVQITTDLVSENHEPAYRVYLQQVGHQNLFKPDD